MRILLVDPYYLNGCSPPSWVLGQLEGSLIERGHEVVVSDFNLGSRTFASLREFRDAEARFVGATAETAARCDLVYVSTAFGVPQKPTPVLARVQRLVAALAADLPTLPVVVGGAQVEYLAVQGRSAAEVVAAGNVVAWLRDDQALLDLPLLDDGGSAGRPTGPGPITAAWNGWALDGYPDYRAVLTSIGCRYACSFCFESKQPFRAFRFGETLAPYVTAGQRSFAIEDSTILGAHRLPALLRDARDLPPDVTYSCYALVAEIAKTTAADLETLRRHGMHSVILGIESPDAETLRRYHKNVRRDIVRAAIEKLHGAEIAVQGCFMLGIPGVSLTDTSYTIEYALELDVDVRRWHIFQPDFADPPQDIITREPLSLERFAMLDVNIPDNLLPEALADAPQEMLLEEHCLIRAIPFADERTGDLQRIRYAAGYDLAELYARVVDALRRTRTSFNEEDSYALLGSPDGDPSIVADAGSWLISR